MSNQKKPLVPADPYAIRPKLVPISYRDTEEFRETLNLVAETWTRNTGRKWTVMKVMRKLLRDGIKNDTAFKKRSA